MAARGTRGPKPLVLSNWSDSLPKIVLLPTRLPAAFSEKLGRTVARTGLSPNMLSLAGFAGNAAAAWLVIRGDLVLAGIVYLFFSAVDLLDGAVARATGRATPYGAVLDAVLDRASEALLLVGCAWHFAERDEQWYTLATYAGLFGSVAVSYMRARAEVLGVSMRDGLFRRQERVVLLGAGLLFSALLGPVMVALAALSNLTALQRFVILGRLLRESDGA